MVNGLKPTLTTPVLTDLWARWTSVGHNSQQRFGQYVMTHTDYIPSSENEDQWGINLFYETDAQKCYDFLSACLQDSQT